MSEFKVGDVVYCFAGNEYAVAVVVSFEADDINIVKCSGVQVRIRDRRRISHLHGEAVTALRRFERRALNLARAIQILKSKQQANDE